MAEAADAEGPSVYDYQTNEGVWDGNADDPGEGELRNQYEGFARRLGDSTFPATGNIDWRNMHIGANGNYNNPAYSASVNRLGTMFSGPAESNLPPKYVSGEIRANGRDRPLSTEERYPAYDRLVALNPEEQGQVNAYLAHRKGAIHPNAQYVLNASVPREDRPPLSLAQRKANARSNRIAIERKLATAYDNPADRFNAEDLLHRQRKVERWQKDHAGKKYWDPLTLSVQEADEDYLQNKRALQNIHRSLPASITKPEYVPFLANPAIRGIDYSQYDGFKDKNLLGYSFKTMTPDQRNKQIFNLFRMVGVLNLRPTFDERLTSIESAKQVYNETDYNIFLWDADNNILTPGVVVITTKNPQYTHKGEVIPANSPIAIGGWSLADATEARSIENLKNIMYYGQFPTDKLRSLNKRSDYVGAYFGKASDLKADRGLKLITQTLRRIIFEGNHFFIPQKIQRADKRFADIPTYITLQAYQYPDTDFYTSCLTEAGYTGDPGYAGVYTFTPKHFAEQAPVQIAHLKLSSPIFNTFMSWVAKLFFNMYMLTDQRCPFNPNVNDGEGTNGIVAKSKTASLATEALVHGIGGYELSNVTYTQPQRGKTQYDINITVTNNHGVVLDTEGPMPSAHGNKIQTLVSIHEDWNHSYFDDAALNIILRDPTVLRWVQAYCENFQAIYEANKQEIDNAFKAMAHVILYHTMNSSIEDYIDDIIHQPVSEQNYPVAFRRYIYAYGAELKFNNYTDCQNLVTKEASNSTTIHTVSKKNWQTVILTQKLTQRCYTWVGKSKNIPPTRRVVLPAAADYAPQAAKNLVPIAQGLRQNTGQRYMAPVGQIGNYLPAGENDRSWENALEGNNNMYSSQYATAQQNSMNDLVNTLSGNNALNRPAINRRYDAVTPQALLPPLIYPPLPTPGPAAAAASSHPPLLVPPTTTTTTSASTNNPFAAMGPPKPVTDTPAPTSGAFQNLSQPGLPLDQRPADVSDFVAKFENPTGANPFLTPPSQPAAAEEESEEESATPAAAPKPKRKPHISSAQRALLEAQNKGLTGHTGTRSGGSR